MYYLQKEKENQTTSWGVGGGGRDEQGSEQGKIKIWDIDDLH